MAEKSLSSVKFKELRKSYGISQIKLSTISNITLVCVQKCENTNENVLEIMSFLDLYRLSCVYEMNLLSLYECLGGNPIIERPHGEILINEKYSNLRNTLITYGYKGTKCENEIAQAIGISNNVFNKYVNNHLSLVRVKAFKYFGILNYIGCINPIVISDINLDEIRSEIKLRKEMLTS